MTMVVSEVTRIPIAADVDVLIASQKGRALAQQCGLALTAQYGVATAISELAHNILAYAAPGEVVLAAMQRDGRHGLLIIARDEGPGIPDLEKALEDGYSTGNGLGLGLSGARRLMDEFEIFTTIGKGTLVIMKKWKN